MRASKRPSPQGSIQTPPSNADTGRAPCPRGLLRLGLECSELKKEAIASRVGRSTDWLRDAADGGRTSKIDAPMLLRFLTDPEVLGPRGRDAILSAVVHAAGGRYIAAPATLFPLVATGEFGGEQVRRAVMEATVRLGAGTEAVLCSDWRETVAQLEQLRTCVDAALVAARTAGGGA